MTYFRIAIRVLLIAFTIIILISIVQSVSITSSTISIKKTETDSLTSEIFMLQTTIQRYEIMMDKVKEENPSLYEKVVSETE